MWISGKRNQRKNQRRRKKNQRKSQRVSKEYEWLKQLASSASPLGASVGNRSVPDPKCCYVGETTKAMLSYFDKFLASFHTLTETVKDMRSGARNSTQTLKKYKGERGRMQHFVLGYRAMPRKWRCNLTTFQWFNHCNFANYSACHEKWHCNFTNIVPAPKSSTPASLQLHQICACCERSHCSFTKDCARNKQ